MARSIFISHAVKDKEISDAFVSFLERALQIPQGEIVCTSILGDGIPIGKDFTKFIKEQLSNPKVVVILLLTENYFKSVFAVCEMGASWALEVRWLPIMVPPLEYKDLNAVLTGIQACDATSSESLGDMRDRLAGFLPLLVKQEKIGMWEHCVKTFTTRVKEIASRPPALPQETSGPNDFEVQRSVDFYNTVAPHYDKGVSNDFIGTHTDLNRVIEEQISSGKETSVLDLGGGTGKIFRKFDTNQEVAWHYCDACPAMLNIFNRFFGKTPALREAVCQDAEEYLHKCESKFDIIILSFLISSMPHLIDFSLIKRRLKDGGLLIIVEANPTYSEKKPKFSILDKSSNVKYSLKIRPIDAPSLSRNASVVGFKIFDLLSHNKGEQPYSYIAMFRKK